MKVKIKNGMIKASDVSVVLSKLTTASDSRDCFIFKAKDGKWYMEIEAWGVDDEEEGPAAPINHYGPFDSEDATIKWLGKNLSNPGGWMTDRSGEIEVPPKLDGPKKRSF